MTLNVGVWSGRMRPSPAAMPRRKHGAGDVVEVAGEVFAPCSGRGMTRASDAAGAFGGFFEDAVGGCVVANRRDAAVDADFDLRRGDLFDAAGDLIDLLDRLRRGRRRRACGACRRVRPLPG